MKQIKLKKEFIHIMLSMEKDRCPYIRLDKIEDFETMLHRVSIELTHHSRFELVKLFK